MGIEEILNNVDTLAESGEHVRFHLFPHTDRAVVWRANRVYNVRKKVAPSLTDTHTLILFA